MGKHISMKNNFFGWVEIPVADMNRAIKFYDFVFGFQLSQQQFGDQCMAWFPNSSNENARGAGGSLVLHEDYIPSVEGTLAYISVPSGDVSEELRNVEIAGGKVLLTKTLIGEGLGYMALILDSEGNKIALHND